MEEYDTRCLMLLSGGVDSLVAAWILKESHPGLSALHIRHSQPAQEHEHKAAEQIARCLGIPFETALFQVPRNLTTGEIFARNAILLLLAALHAHSDKPVTIGLGIHSGTPYYDCSPRFIEEIHSLLDAYSGGTIRVAAPLLTWRKEDIFNFALGKKLPIQLARSCEASSAKPCGVCASCKDRSVLDARA